MRYEHVRGSVKVASVGKKFTEKKLRWYGYERWEEGNILRRMADVPVPGKRWRGRRTTRWKDLCTDMESAYRAGSGGRNGQDKVEERSPKKLFW